ncbi:hypothetical protein GALL_248700 [mine drainage metagenome]|uniref:Uncharacterized protein n=1 Tax=mine drainage metagenome TaxID=410659 RepID=A0A1J5RM40_9ZZZZ
MGRVVLVTPLIRAPYQVPVHLDGWLVAYLVVSVGVVGLIAWRVARGAL